MNQYELMAKQIEAIAKEDPDRIPVLSNTSALIYDTVTDVNWAGFYLVDGDHLTLGPFQGKVACIHLYPHKGVCGTAWAEDQTLVVANVHEFAGHIACDSKTNSEIVIPIHDIRKPDYPVVGVLDIDSIFLDRFNPEDREGLELVVRTLESVTRF
jgi:L-methionine (R)-S-oxide reductase